MKYITLFTALIIAGALNSCQAPVGNGTQKMVPRTNVENLERQSAVTPNQGMGIDGYAASQYASGSRSRTIFVPSY